MASIRIAFIQRDTTKVIAWGVEPALNKALAYGIGEGLFTLHNDKYALTEKGHEFSKNINSANDLFQEEKIFLEYLGKKKINEEFITDLTKRLLK